MSSAELRARIERLKLEEEYRKYLNGGQPQQQNVAKGKNAADSILKAYGNSTFKKITDELLIGAAKIGVDAASNAVKNKISRNNDRKRAMADFAKKDAEERRAEAKRERENSQEARRQKYEDKFYETYWQKRAEEQARNDAKKYEEWLKTHTIG